MGILVITHWLKGFRRSCDQARGFREKKVAGATVLQIWGRGKDFGGFGRVSPYGWEGLTIKVQMGLGVLRVDFDFPGVDFDFSELTFVDHGL
nr:hypothetical protein [Tanacetum cinerariifolium]